MKQMNPVIQKFKVDDEVRTNELYRRTFPHNEEFKGRVAEVNNSVQYIPSEHGYIYPGCDTETFVLVKVWIEKVEGETVEEK